MTDFSPIETARKLSIAPETLRKWAREFATSLSATAQGGARSRRRYQDDDIAVLRDIGILLDNGLTYDQVRARLPQPGLVNPAQPSPASDDSSSTSGPALIGDVTVIEPGDRAAALDTFLAAQSALIQQQQEHIAQITADLAQQREQNQLDRATLDTLAAQLDQAKDEKAAALVELGKIPRWVRALLGISSVM